ncbi:hypothetical protein PENSPDRAFT_750467 [Peniophora sp. CONT]|nr:hypothetical protein PENSPDRAFT_750467 [Peniophora sp. CONT]
MVTDEPSVDLDLEERKALATQLKLDANTLFAAGNYTAARDGYTEAIKVYSEDPVIYCNRAQAHINLESYAEAASDAQKATELDTTSTKAWARLGKAQRHLGQLTQSSFSLGVALDTLPPASKMTPADKRLREEVEKLIHLVLLDGRRPENMLDTVWKGEANFLPKRNSLEAIEQPDVNGKRPWDCAYAILLPILNGSRPVQSKEERQAEDKIVMQSSATLTYAAYVEWAKGLHALSLLQTLPRSDGSGQVDAAGRIDCTLQFVTGIVREYRVHRTLTPQENARYSSQMLFEIQTGRAWKISDVEEIIRDAARRLKQEGWSEPLKLSLTSTINIWIFCSFRADNELGHFTEALSLYKSTIRLLEWARGEWPAEKSGRPEILQEWYLRGVKRLSWQSFIKASQESTPDSAAFRSSPDYDLDEFFEEVLACVQDAEESLKTAAERYMPGRDASFLPAYWLYPIGEGYATMAWARYRKAKESPDDGAEYNRAAQYWIKAAGYVWHDDEYHVYWLALAIESLWQHKAPAREILPLCRVMRDALPGAMKLWQDSTDLGRGRSRDFIFELVTAFDDTVRGMINRGEATLNDVLAPEGWLDHTARN